MNHYFDDLAMQLQDWMKEQGAKLLWVLFSLPLIYLILAFSFHIGMEWSNHQPIWTTQKSLFEDGLSRFFSLENMIVVSAATIIAGYFYGKEKLS